MFCSTCGCELKETDKVCLACGQPNENYVAPEGAEEVAAEEAVAVVTEEVVEEAVEAAPANGKKDMVKPIVALALSAFAFFSFASGLIPLILAIVAKVLAKPYKNVTEKPVSIFVKITNILSLVTIILSIIAIVVGVIAFTVSFIGALISGAAVGGVAMEMDLFEIIEDLLTELGLM